VLGRAPHAAKVPSGTTDIFFLLHSMYSEKPPELLGKIELFMMFNLVVNDCVP
jgi:hypothetical protein